MECPTCHSDNPSGQKFCGSCGHKLETQCTQCGAPNPPDYKFCGECGASLILVSAIFLARSGLITQADHKAAALLGRQQEELQGKPFSLFIERVDMVVFFSHWNELLSSSKIQTFELALKHKHNKNIFVALECSAVHRASGHDAAYLFILKEITEDRLVSDQLQYQQDLLSLIFTTTNNIRSAADEHFDQSIENALKNICLISKSDRSFIYRVNRTDRCLDLAYQWSQPSTTPARGKGQPGTIPLRKIKRAMVRFLKEQAYVINDVSQLSAAERNELLEWHSADLGALICHLIHAEKQPVAIVGVAKNSVNGGWPSDCIALVKFLGQLISDKLPVIALDVQLVEDSDASGAPIQTPGKEPQKSRPDETDSGDRKPQKPSKSLGKADPNLEKIQLTREPRNLVNINQPMLIEKLSDPEMEEQQTVFPRDDGLVLLTCPMCSHQETISMGWFEKLGNAIKVKCPCRARFAAVLEKRRAHRKVVKLDGFFTLKSGLEPKGAHSSIWGPMVVRDISKTGLRFSSDRSDLVHAGDLLMVRFNLDNTNQALINKPARVIATTDNLVGCQFEGEDSYDITLGFYFI